MIGQRFDHEVTVPDEKGATVETFYRVINGEGYEFYRQVHESGFRVVWVFRNDEPVPVHSFMGVPE